VKLPTIDLSAICLDETAVLAPDGEAAITSVTGETDDHCPKTDGEGQSSRQLDVPRVRTRPTLCPARGDKASMSPWASAPGVYD